MIDSKQAEYKQGFKDVKKIDIRLGGDIYDKNVSSIKDALQKKYPKANVHIEKLEGGSKNKDSGFSIEYQGAKTLKKD